MDKKDKLKCYTRKANDGHIYTTCDDKSVKPKKKKIRLVLKQPKEAATDAMNAIKEVRNISGSVKLKKQFIERLKAEMEKSKYEKVLKATKEFEATKEAAKPKPANYDMLRPEIRKNILEFAGAKSPIDVARDELIKLATPTRVDKKPILEKTYVFFVINNTLDKKGSRNLSELDIATTYKTSPRGRKIFLRDPIEVLKEYRKRTGEVKYKNVIETTLNRMKVYYKLMKTADDATAGSKPYRSQYVDEIVAIVKKNKNLFKNNFFPNAVRQKNKGQITANFRTDGIKDTIDGGLNFDYTDPMDVVVSFDRMYINIKSNSDFTKLIKEIHNGIKSVQERVLMGEEERDVKNLLAEESKMEFQRLQEEAQASKAKYKSQMEALAKSQNKILSNDGKGGFYLF